MPVRQRPVPVPVPEQGPFAARALFPAGEPWPARVLRLPEGGHSERGRLARENFGYVKPGEEAYNILPARTEPMGLPEGWPFTGVEQAIAAG